MSILDEMDRIEGQILEENPQTIEDLVELFLRMYESDEGIDLGDFVFTIEGMQLKAIDAK